MEPWSRRRRLLAVAALTVVAAMIAAPESSAHAGQGAVRAVKLCGLSGCRQLDQPFELFHAGGSRGPRAVETRPAPPGPYYEVHLQYAAPPTAFFVPAPGTLRSYPDPVGFSNPRWLQLEPRVLAALRRQLRGLEPFPRPVLSSARLDGRGLAHPQAYLSLYRSLPAHAAAVSREGASIELRGEELSPWADGYNVLAYSAKERLLVRDGETVQLSPQLARLIDEPEFAEPRRPWALLAGGLALGSLAVVAALRLRATAGAQVRRASVRYGTECVARAMLED